jgi:hypothetical protein
MQSLPYPNTLTDRELVRIADAHLLTNDSLPLDWQRVLIDRIADTVPPFRPEPHPIRVQAASDGRG